MGEARGKEGAIYLDANVSDVVGKKDNVFSEARTRKVDEMYGLPALVPRRNTRGPIPVKVER
jgi:hypothetical protein